MHPKPPHYRSMPPLPPLALCCCPPCPHCPLSLFVAALHAPTAPSHSLLLPSLPSFLAGGGPSGRCGSNVRVIIPSTSTSDGSSVSSSATRSVSLRTYAGEGPAGWRLAVGCVGLRSWLVVWGMGGWADVGMHDLAMWVGGWVGAWVGGWVGG